MIIGGLWHGAAWTFVAWGTIHGLALVLERRWDLRHPPADNGPSPWSPVVRWLVTFHVVCLAWVFFRAESFDKAGEMLWQLTTDWGVGTLVKPMLVFVIVAMIVSQFVPGTVVERGQVAFSKAAPALQGVGLALAFLLIDTLGPTGVAPFIYFQF